VSTRAFVVGGLLVALVFAVGISQVTSDGPDGLESVAASTGFDSSAEEHALAGGLFADYATEGISNESLSLAIAGAVGVIVTLAVGAGVLFALRERRSRDPAAV
jgi:cobalt/nickel transport system permease protein